MLLHYYEKKVIDITRPFLPSHILLPEILEYDEDNNILCMTDVACNGSLLQNSLSAGKFDKHTACAIGQYLGLSHKHTFAKGVTIRGSKEEDRHNWQLFLNMRTQGINSSRMDANAHDKLKRLYTEALFHHTYDLVINMDCCPKNIFQRGDDKTSFIDFELASGCGDPAYDIGFALGHYMLFALLKGANDDSVTAMNALFDSYLKEMDISAFGNFEERMISYAGAVLLYRVAGSSPAPYIERKRIHEIVQKGSAMVTCGLFSLEKAREILR